MNCAQLGQGGVVFLVGTTPAGPAARSCDVPAGKALLIPLINAECSLAIDRRRTYAARLRVRARSHGRGRPRARCCCSVGLHGWGPGSPSRPVLLSLFRVDSPPFTWTSVAGNAFGVPVFTNNPAAANGYFVMLRRAPARSVGRVLRRRRSGTRVLHAGELHLAGALSNTHIACRWTNVLDAGPPKRGG